MMDWFKAHFGKDYKPNTRETVRRQTVHQFVAAGLALYNPDQPDRPVNSPKAAYQLSPEALRLLQAYGSDQWPDELALFLKMHDSLARQYASDRELAKVPLNIRNGEIIKLSPGDHSKLIRNIIEEFGPRFAPGSKIVYVGDTGEKWGYADEELLASFGIPVSTHGKMPDVVLHDQERDWLFLIEAVTSHGPMDGKRIGELKSLFPNAKAVYVSAFPDKAALNRYLSTLAWETEVWLADSPTHLIHFNGSKFLGPYE